MIFRRFPKISSFVRRCSKMSPMEQEPLINMDKLEIVKLSLPLHPNSSVNLQYYDSSPTNIGTDRQPIIIGSHGSPGSHNDFKYMVPSLLSAGFRVIIPNWPGFGVTESPPEDQFTHKNLERSQLLSNFVKAIGLKKIDVIFGHSSGAWPLPPFLVDNPKLCSAAVMITPGCVTPHKPLRPYWLTQMIDGWLTTWMKPFVKSFLFFMFTKLFNMRVTHRDHSAVGFRIMANVDFPNFRKYVSILKETKNPPIILVCSGKDHLIEKERSFEYAEQLGCSQSDGSIYCINESQEMNGIIQKILPPKARLHRHFMIMFNRGNHYTQKTEAPAICSLIKAIIESNNLEKI